MSFYRITKSEINGQIEVPPSKSHTLRAILFAAMAKGKSVIRNYLPSPDALAMIAACRLFGADIQVFDQHLEIKGIEGNIRFTEDVIQAGNSGIVLRFIAALASLSSTYTVITGDQSIRHQRPMQPLLDALTQLGAFAVSARGDGFAPVLLRGPWQISTVTVVGEDSQPVSALLIAAAFRKQPTEIYVTKPGEQAWVLLTLDWFEKLGISYENHEFEKFYIHGSAHYEGFEYTVPADLSSVAYPIAAALITNSELQLNNIDMHDIQGDKVLIYELQKMGANIDIDYDEHKLTIKQNSKLQGKEIDINTFIDGVTILAVLGCYAEGETRIINAAVARQKECDRLQAITSELRKMGADIIENVDNLVVRHSALKGADLFSYNDHRMVMSLSVAALGASGDSKIGPVECVSKTYPNFAHTFKKAGAKIEVVP